MPELSPSSMPRRIRTAAAVRATVLDVLVEDDFSGYAWSVSDGDQTSSGHGDTPADSLLEAIASLHDVPQAGCRLRVCVSPNMGSKWLDTVELPEQMSVTVESTRTSWMPEPWRNRLQMYVSPALGGSTGWLLFNPRSGVRIASGTMGSTTDALGAVVSVVAQSCATYRANGPGRPLLHVTASPKVYAQTAQAVADMVSPNGDRYATMSAQPPPPWVAGQVAVMDSRTPSTATSPDGPLVIATDGSAGLRSSAWAWVDDMGRYQVSAHGRIQIATMETAAVRHAARTCGHPGVILSDSMLAVRSAPVPAHVRVRWVKGHAGHTMNEAADRLALHARRRRDAGTEPDEALMDWIVTEMLDALGESGQRHPDARPSRRTE